MKVSFVYNVELSSTFSQHSEKKNNVSGHISLKSPTFLKIRNIIMSPSLLGFKTHPFAFLDLHYVIRFQYNLNRCNESLDIRKKNYAKLLLFSFCDVFIWRLLFKIHKQNKLKPTYKRGVDRENSKHGWIWLSNTFSMF